MSSKDVEAFVRRLRHAGLVVERSGGGHYKVMSPQGGTLAFLPFSPSTNRWRENTIAQLRKRGIVLEDDPHHPHAHGQGHAEQGDDGMGRQGRGQAGQGPP